MTESDILNIINQAIEGNELPFNTFFEKTFRKLQPKLQAITNCEHDTKDVYLICMQKFWERFVINKEPLPNNCNGYIYVMCRNAFLLKKREIKSSFVLSGDIEKHQMAIHAHTLPNEKKDNSAEDELLKYNALAIALETLCPKCKSLIENDLDKETKLKDLMVEFGYSNYQALVQAKYNCKKRLIKKAQEVLSNLKTEKLNIK